MTRIKFDTTLLQTMATFEKVARVSLKDCFEDEVSKQMVFIVNEGLVSKAVGKGGANVKRLEQLLKKKIRIVAFSEDKLQFLQNLLQPLKIKDAVELDDGTIELEAIDRKTRGYIIGRAAQNLRNLENNLRRHFEVKEIKVKDV